MDLMGFYGDFMRSNGILEDDKTLVNGFTTNYGKSPCCMGKLAMSIAMFNSYVTNYQRIKHCKYRGFMPTLCIGSSHSYGML